jgi:hypothetical protein
MRKKQIAVTLTILTFAFALVLLANETALAGPAQIQIINLNAPGVGFNDPTPAAPVGGNTGTTLGEQRMIAFQHAENIWSARLNSDVPIRIRAQFTALGSNVLGSAGAVTFIRDFPNAPLPNTWYHVALANSLAGFDLVPTADDINTNFSSNFPFYLGIDNNAPSGQPDLVAVLLHEFAHGLGFSQGANLTTGVLLGNTAGRFPDVYNSRLLDTSTGKYWSQMTNAERVASATNSGRVVFDGAFVTAGVPSVLSFGVPVLRVNSPAAIANVYAVGAASFGPALTSSPITNDVVQALDAADAAGPTTFDACSPITNAATVAGKIALVDRGTCGFTIKVKNAQNAGAIAVLVADNVAGSPPPGLGGADPTITIPSVRITLADGNAIKAQLANGVNATLSIDLSIRAGTDPLGRMRVNAPSPVQLGSSISHFDPISFRNLLMEPAINSDLTHKVKAPFDLTFELFRDIGWTFPDADGDGFADDEDCNPNSNLSPTVVIGGNNSGVPNTLFDNGCTISDLIAQIAASAKNHGEFVSGVAELTNNLVNQGVITGRQKGAIQNAAAKANIP